MADNDNAQDPDDHYSIAPQNSPQTSGTDTNGWYYRPSSGMSDWAARLSRLQEGNNVNNAVDSVNGEDLQLSDVPVQTASGAAESSGEMQALRDSYDAQEKASAQFRQDQPLGLGTAASGYVSTPDFLTKQVLRQPQQGASDSDSGDQNAQPEGTPATAGSTSGPFDPQSLKISDLTDVPRAMPSLDYRSNDPDYKKVWLSMSGNVVPYSSWGFEAGMDVDADGAGNTYGPNNSGLDWNKNGKNGNKWVGVVTDKNGNPIIQQSGPNKGMYVSTTTLQDTTKNRIDPARYVDSTGVNYYVLPGGTALGRELSRAHGAKPGDFGVMIYNGIVSPAIFGDIGPAKKLGEASISSAQSLNIPASPRTGGVQSGVKYIIFPGSGIGWPLTNEQIRDNAMKLFQDWGGLERAQYINSDSQ